MAISMTEVAFEGFRLIAKKPAAVIGWAAAYLVYAVAVGAVMVQLMGPQMMELQRLAREMEGSQDPVGAQRILTVFASMAPGYLVLILAGLAFTGAIMAAVDRAVLRPEQGAPLYLSVGMPEAMQALVAVVWYILFMLWMIGTGIVAAILGLLGGFAASVLGVFGGVLTGLAIILVCLFSMAVFFVRFSLASPATFAEGGFRFFRSWGLTNGHFWPLLGAYFVTSLVTLAIILAIVCAAFVITAGASGFSPATLRDWVMVDTSSLSAYFSPTRLYILVGGALLSAFAYAMFFGAGARAYEQVSRA